MCDLTHASRSDGKRLPNLCTHWDRKPVVVLMVYWLGGFGSFACVQELTQQE